MVCTSLKQSKTLSKILPLESADLWLDTNEFEPRLEKHYHQYLGEMIEPIPCWSLDALLAIIAKQNFTIKSSYIDECEYNIDIPCRHCKIWFSSLLDAAFEMIVWLKENKKL